ncbi:MAG: Cof-type HAD-IIB family hydrolase [Negativicutes bacterium]|nr:Cof-type HAD-IIB family hydrolase [Negativicutes bacterium]
MDNGNNIKIRLLALDLDGTLNNSEHQISPRTLKALMAAQRQGIKIALTSGRPAPGLRREAEWLQLAAYGGYLLSYNGGLAVRAADGVVLFENRIPRGLAVELLRHIEPLPVVPVVDDGHHIYTDNPDNYKIRDAGKGNCLPLKIVANVAGAVDFDPGKIAIAAPPETMAELGEEITAPFRQRLSFVFSAPFYLECTALGVSKGNGLARLAGAIGVDRREIMAFGDADNDIEMLRFAGCGVAMGNAGDTVRQAADLVTLSNDQDGIAVVVERLLDNGGYWPPAGT